ncbi:MAG: protocatechuate 4,5-dioxygenase subunit alpha [Rhodobacteraceae bacterium]|nr:protocatechuate 4,5-dioxygenase subunit alpha [Paracoccaceae bacterium]
MPQDPIDAHMDIPGTTLFDGKMAMKGYALNKMCYAFNGADARAEYLQDPEAYFDKFGLNDEQKQACRNKNVLEMIAAGGNVYYLAKFAGIYKLNMQDIGAQQTGMTVDEFKEKLRSAGD